MQVYIESFEAWHALLLMDPTETKAGAPVISRSQAEWLEQQGKAYSLVTSAGDVLACGGPIEQWPGRTIAWMCFSKNSGQYMLRIVRFVKLVLEGIVGRVEMSVVKNYEVGHRWAKLLGFEVETPCLKAYGVNGEDHVGYVKFNEVE